MYTEPRSGNVCLSRYDEVLRQIAGGSGLSSRVTFVARLSGTRSQSHEHNCQRKATGGRRADKKKGKKGKEKT